MLDQIVQDFINAILEALGLDESGAVPASAPLDTLVDKSKQILVRQSAPPERSAAYRQNMEVVRASARSIVGATASTGHIAGWLSAAWQYGGRVQDMQDKAALLQLAFSPVSNPIRSNLGLFEQMNDAQRDIVPHNPYKADRFDIVNGIAQRGTGKVRENRVQGIFNTEAAPVVLMTEEKQVVYPENHHGLCLSPGGNLATIKEWHRPPLALWTPATLTREGGSMNRSATRFYPDMEVQTWNWTAGQDITAAYFGLYPMAPSKRPDWKFRQPQDVPRWWRGTPAQYAERLCNYLWLARYTVWCIEQARSYTGIEPGDKWRNYCSNWGIGCASATRTRTRAKLDEFADHCVINRKGSDQSFDKVRGDLQFDSKMFKGLLTIDYSTVESWAASAMQNIVPPRYSGPMIRENRLLCDLPSALSSMRPAVWASYNDHLWRIQLIKDYQRQLAEESAAEKRQVKSIMGLVSKIVIAIITTALTWGASAPAGGALIAQGVKDIIEVIRNAASAGFEGLVAILQAALETYGPALLQRAINRALQAADIGVDLPNIADSLCRGVPLLSDNTIEQTSDHMKALFKEVVASGYEHAQAVTGSLVSDLYVPEIPNFSARSLLR